MAFFSRKNTATSTIKINYDGKEAESGLKSLKKTIATVISAEVLRRLALYTKGLAELGSQVESVEKNFENFARRAGRTTDEMMNDLRNATLGMVNDLELQQRAMQAMVSGVKFDDIITAMEFVTKFATATGTDVSQKMMTTMTGLARGSAQFLDDIGIQVIGSKDVVNDAIAQMKEKMDQFTLSEEDASVQANNLRANFENLSASIGKKLVPAWSALVGVANKYIKAITQPELTEVEREIEKMTGLIDHLNKSLAGPNLVDKFFAKIGGAQIRTNKEILVTIKEVERSIEILEERRRKILGGDKGSDTNEFLRSRIADQRKVIDDETEKTNKETEKKLEQAAKKEDELRRKQNEITAKWLDEQTADVINHTENINEISQQEWEERISIQKEAQKVLLGDREFYFQERFALLDFWEQEYTDKAEEIEILRTDLVRQQAEERLRIIEKEQQEAASIAKQGFSTTKTISSAIMDVVSIRTQKQIDELERLNLSEEEYTKRKGDILRESEEQARSFAIAQQAIAVAEAWVNVGNAALDVFATEGGGVATKSLAMAAAIAIGAAETVKMAAITFETGQVGIGGIEQSRQKDNTLSLIGRGESVIGAPQTAMHEDELRAINNNTANTARGINSMKSSVTNNFFGLSTEQVLQATIAIDRRNLKGRKI
jgi:hypothetical protein